MRLNFRCGPPIAGMAMLAALSLAGCAAPGPNAASQYAVVNVSFAYAGPKDKPARQWRALLTALDRCHMQGYRDAQPARAPQTVCEEAIQGGSCSRFLATASYDCIGMGYQSN